MLYQHFIVSNMMSLPLFDGHVISMSAHLASTMVCIWSPKLVTFLQIFSMANFFDSGILNFLVPVCDSTLTLSFRNTLQEWERVILCRRLGRYKLSSFAHTSWREGRTYLEARTKGGSHSSWAHGRQQQGMVWPERVIGVPLWNAVWWKRRSYLMF